MKTILAVGLLMSLVAAAAPAAADCTSDEQTTDLGVATVRQYEHGCSDNWGNYGYVYTYRGVAVDSDAANADANLGRYEYFADWGNYGYHYTYRQAYVQADAADGAVNGNLYGSYDSYSYYSDGYNYCGSYYYFDLQLHPVGGYMGDDPAPCLYALAGSGAPV